MSFKKLLIAAVILTLVLGTFIVGNYVVAQTKEQAYRGPTFEYMLTGMRLQPKWVEEGGKKVMMAPEMQSEFNFHGAEGWEYVGSFPGKEDAIFMVFKRPKQK